MKKDNLFVIVYLLLFIAGCLLSCMPILHAPWWITLIAIAIPATVLIAFIYHIHKCKSCRKQ